MNILLITEQRDAQWNKTSFETLAAAQQIAAETKSRLAAVVIGKGISALAGGPSSQQSLPPDHRPTFRSNTAA